MLRRSLPVLLLLLLIGSPSFARDQEERPARHTPQKNFSHLHDDAEWLVRAFNAAETAADAEDASGVIRALQSIIDQRTSRESAGDAAPYVRAVHGTATYEGAWLVARHRLQALGEGILEAYAREYGRSAEALLARGIQRRDPASLQAAAARFLGLPAGRRAALLLVDLAIERGDRDAALGWLQDLEDLEAVSGERPETLAPWRAARAARQAALLAKDEASRVALEATLAALDASDAKALDPVPEGRMRRPPPPTHWPTTGGNASRSAVPPALGGALRLGWIRGPESLESLADEADPVRRDADRPSLWLPPRAVASEDHLFVSDGEALHIYDIETGTPVLDNPELGTYPGARRDGIGTDTDEDRRIRFGLLEGHALSIHPVARYRWSDGREHHTPELGAGWLVLAAVPDGTGWTWRRRSRSGHEVRDDHIQAFHWNGSRLVRLWRVGGTGSPSQRGGLPYDTRLYGAPLVYAGRVWVAGVRAAKATQDRWEAWLYAFDPETGRVVSSTHLGTGTPMRTGRMDEVIPTSPAAAHGRIVVGTALGIVAAVDAHDGRIRWAHRYDRAVETERGAMRNRDKRDEGLRTSSFMNEPPILAGGRCYLTPTDSEHLLILFDRPRLGLRALLSEARPRDLGNARHMIEHIAGVDTRRRENRAGSLVLVGQGQNGEPPGPLVTVYDAGTPNLAWPRDARELRSLWEGISPTGFGAQPYGRALVTDGEIYVPQEHGIAVFELEDRNGDGSHFLTLLDQRAFGLKPGEDVPGRPYGNLIPIPGKGLVAVSATTVAFWAPR